jgi:alcohol dehydrogenase
MPQKCRSVAKYGHEVAEGRTALSGGLAEYILLRPGSAVLKVDSSIPDEVACPANCATATVAAAFRSAENLTDQRVLILGAGLLGLTACAFAKSRGAAQVVACDLNPDRLKLAEQFGADTTVVWHADKAERQRLLSDAADGGLFDVVVELSGSPDAVEVACELGDIGARIILVGTVMGSRPVQIDPEAVVRRWLTIRGVHNYTPEDLRTAVRFLEQYHTQFPFAKLVEASFALADINQAIDFAIDKRPVRVAVRP